MIIEEISCAFPKYKVDNEEILSLIKYHSLRSYKGGDLDELLYKVERMLKQSGIKSRFWRNSEKPIDLINQAYSDLKEKTGVLSSEIDAVIYVGVDRGFVEPDNASIICAELGISKAKTFDIVDACMGWKTALYISQSFFKTYHFKNILIISSECPMNDNGVVFPCNFKINNQDELRWKFASYTLGEGVSMTLLRRSDLNWRFEFESEPNGAHLCTIPLSKYNEYISDPLNLKGLQEMTFQAYGSDMTKLGIKPAIEVFERYLKSVQKVKFVLPHSISEAVTGKAMSGLKREVQSYSAFSEFGNLATSAIPFSIFKGKFNNHIKKGDHLAGWIGSGGLKFAAFDIFV